MAKELPYFKFEPSEWEAGNIQAASRESKGLFIEICSLYWLRLGELPYALALQKLCNGHAEHMEQLCNLEIIGVKEGQIFIEFLDEQLDEFQKTSEKRAKAANKRWKNASALQKQVNSNAIREEKRREEERREDKSNRAKRFSPPSLNDVKDYCFERKNNIDPQNWHDFYSSKGWMVGKNKMKDWKASIRTWENKEKNSAKKEGYKSRFNTSIEPSKFEDLEDGL